MPISLADIQEKRTVTLPSGDRIRFEWTEPSTMISILALRESEIPDRAYLNQALALLVEDPKPLEDQIVRLSDEELVQLVEDYLKIPAMELTRSEREDKNYALASVHDARVELDSNLNAETLKLHESTKKVMSTVQKSILDFTISTGVTGPTLGKSHLHAYNSMLNWQSRLADQIRIPTFEYRSPLADFPKYVDSMWVDRLATFQRGWTSMMTDILDRHVTFQDSFASAMQSIASVNLPSIIRGWDITLSPDLLEWIEEGREAHRASFLVEVNLQFLSDLSDDTIAEIIDDVMEVPKSQQNAHITRRLHTHTAHPDFLDAVLQELSSSFRANRRQKILEAAHQAHVNRQYLVSIPTLLAQVEGLTVQLLAEMGYVRWDRSKKKWFEADTETGKYLTQPNPKNSKKRDRIALKGLGDLSKFISKMDENPLPNAFPHLRDDMPRYRNQVLHGTLTNYGEPRKSSILLIMALILSQQLRTLEEENRAVQ